MKCPCCKIGDIKLRKLESEGTLFIECTKSCKKLTPENILWYNYIIRDAEWLGKEAFQDGLKRSANPFKDEILREIWEEGHLSTEGDENQRKRIIEITHELKVLKEKEHKNET